MFSKTLSRYAVSVLGFVFVMSIFIGLSGNIAMSRESTWVPRPTRPVWE